MTPPSPRLNNVQNTALFLHDGFPLRLQPPVQERIAPLVRVDLDPNWELMNFVFLF